MDDFQDADYFGNESATFGDRVYAAREAVGLDQAALAKKLGVKLKTVKAWEDDLAEPRANKLQMIAGLMNVSVMWLLTGEGDGLSGPADTSDLPEDVNGILIEMRRARAESQRLTDRIGLLEKRLSEVVRSA